jgi:uncharacterized membrane protein (UPF0127 family)
VPADKSEPKIRVQDVTRGKTIVTAGRAADNLWTRMKGLIGSAPLKQGEGMLIVPCNSIHTHFMGFPIDVLYVDRAGKVVALDHAMKPWRFGRVHRHARYVIELPAGSLADAGVSVGDELQVSGYTVK